MILRNVELVGEAGGLREIAVAGGTIARVDEPSRGSAPGGPTVELEGAIAFPGLTNSHDHLDFDVYPTLRARRYRDYVDWGADVHLSHRPLIDAIERLPRWVRVRWGALKNVLAGVVSVAHHEERPANLPALAVRTLGGTAIHSVRAGHRWRWRLNAPIGRPPYVIHVGEGTSRAAHAEIDELLRWNLLRRDLVAVHGVAMTAAQAARFTALVWCPASNDVLFGATADVASLKDRTSILLGTDSTLTADWNVWSHLRLARRTGALDDVGLFASVTRTAARVWRLRGGGRIAPGTVADVVVARKKAEGYEAFFAVDPEDILLVLRGGAVVLCDTSLGAELAPCSRSRVRVAGREKWVAEDVPGLLAVLRGHAIEPNLPIEAAS